MTQDELKQAVAREAIRYVEDDTIIGVGSKSRLACQASVLGTEAVTVELLGALSG